MNLFPESMNLFPETFYTYGQIPSGLGGAILRQPQNLGGVPENFVAETGGLQPGQTATREQMKWLYTSGAINNPDSPALWKDENFWDSAFGGAGPFDPGIYGGYEGAVRHFTEMGLRYTAQAKTEDKYTEYVQARHAAAADAAALLVFDSTGRATDASVEASNAYINAVTADELAAVNQAQAQADAARAAVETYIAQNSTSVIAVPTYTDIEIANIVQDQLMNKGNTPGQTVDVLVNQYGIDGQRAVRIVDAEFSMLAIEWAAMQAAAQTAAANAAAQAQAQAQAAAQAEAEAAAMRELEKAQTAAARNFPWFQADMFVNATAEQKAMAYLRYLDMGKNASEIRSAAEAFFGKQRDEDWQLLQDMAKQIAISALTDRAGPIKVTEPPMREEVITQLAKQPAGNAGAIALAALAAALLLGA